LAAGEQQLGCKRKIDAKKSEKKGPIITAWEKDLALKKKKSVPTSSGGGIKWAVERSRVRKRGISPASKKDSALQGGEKDPERGRAQGDNGDNTQQGKGKTRKSAPKKKDLSRGRLPGRSGGRGRSTRDGGGHAPGKNKREGKMQGTRKEGKNGGLQTSELKKRKGKKRWRRHGQKGPSSFRKKHQGNSKKRHLKTIGPRCTWMTPCGSWEKAGANPLVGGNGRKKGKVQHEMKFER